MVARHRAILCAALVAIAACSAPGLADAQAEDGVGVSARVGIAWFDRVGPDMNNIGGGFELTVERHFHSRCVPSTAAGCESPGSASLYPIVGGGLALRHAGILSAGVVGLVGGAALRVRPNEAIGALDVILLASAGIAAEEDRRATGFVLAFDGGLMLEIGWRIDAQLSFFFSGRVGFVAGQFLSSARGDTTYPCQGVVGPLAFGFRGQWP